MHGWHQLDIGGKPAACFEPSQPARFGVIFLHNAKGQPLSVSPTYTRLLDQHRIACVCPFGGSTWWTDRVVPEFDATRSAERYVVDEVGPFTAQNWRLGPRGIGLFGISMGGQGGLRIAFKHPDRFPVVAAVAPAVDYHEYYGEGSVIDALYASKEQCRQDTAPMHLHPSQYPPHIFFCCDPGDAAWFRGCDRLHEKMGALGVRHEVDLTTQAGGHTWGYFDALADRAITSLARGLDHESRRLV
jgi:S-formylglutathione hydrolase